MNKTARIIFPLEPELKESFDKLTASKCVAVAPLMRHMVRAYIRYHTLEKPVIEPQSTKMFGLDTL